MATVWLQLSTRGKVNLTIRTKCCEREITPKIGEEIHLGTDENGKHIYATVSRVAHFLLSNGSAVVTCYDVTPLALFIAISQNAFNLAWEFGDGDKEAWKSLQCSLATKDNFASLGW